MLLMQPNVVVRKCTQGNKTHGQWSVILLCYLRVKIWIDELFPWIWQPPTLCVFLLYWIYSPTVVALWINSFQVALMFSPPAQNCITAESYPFPSPSWCHQRWFPYGRHLHRSWRNHSGTSSTSGLQTHTGNDFSFQRRKVITMKMETKMQKERHTEVITDIKGNSILLLLFTDK